MPYKTKSGSHYHKTLGCCGADTPCGMEGLEPCSICYGKGISDDCSGASAGATEATRMDSTEVYEAAGGSYSIDSSLIKVPFLTEDEQREFDARIAAKAEEGFQNDSLDAYDSSTSAAYSTAMTTGGAKAAMLGMDAPEPRYGVIPETFAGLCDSLDSFGVEEMSCPDQIPESWGSTDPHAFGAESNQAQGDEGVPFRSPCVWG